MKLLPWVPTATMALLLAGCGPMIVAPTPASTPAAYDADRGRLILFGRYVGQGYDHPGNDTWAWDGVRWQRVDPP